MLMMALVLVFALGSVAMAADNSPKVLGTWEVEFPGYGVFQVELTPDGVGAVSQDGKVTEQFGFTMRNDIFAGSELGEDGKLTMETGKLEFPDESTILMKEGDATFTYKRLAPAAADAMSVDNPLIGAWVADLPEIPGMWMEYRTDGTYAYKGGEYEGECSYFVYDNTLFSLSDEGEAEMFSFVVVDDNNIDVTEIQSGAVARFVRQDAALQPTA